jgi:hypothetical protein
MEWPDKPIPTTYKTLWRTFTCHLAFPTPAEAIKAIPSIKPITNSSIQKAHFCPEARFFRMIVHTNTETTIEQELYRMVKVLSDAMPLASRLAISDLSNTITKSGEFALKMTTLVNIKKARRKLMPLHIERTIEPLFNITPSPYDVLCPLFKVYSTNIYSS